MRKLASIQVIKALDPIDGADAIERATVLGWQLVVKKGEFKPGDLAIYVEIDSILPDRYEFEFLRPRKMRIRTVRLKGQISQGICFPLSLLPDDFPIIEDADCTQVLGITKYEPPIPVCLSGIAKGKFPSFIPKTDETRVQVLQHLLDAYKEEQCYITEKLDGSSVTYYFNNEEFGVCSRNLELLEDDENSLWKVARHLDVEAKLRSVGRNLAIQGEFIGEGIQSNKLKIRGQNAIFFNAFDIDKYEYLNYSSLVKLLESLDLPMVPLITDNYKLENDMEAIIQRATIKSLICPEVWAEGIVIRPVNERIDPAFSKELMNNGRISFKAINPEFLLKFGE